MVQATCAKTMLSYYRKKCKGFLEISSTFILIPAPEAPPRYGNKSGKAPLQ